MENKNIFLKKIGRNIKEIIKGKKKEVKDAARGLGISIQAYGKIENGGTDLNISRLFEIAKFFGVSFTQILRLNEGDIFNFTSQNNCGGYQVQTLGVLNVTEESLKTYFDNDIAYLKEKILFFEEVLKKK